MLFVAHSYENNYYYPRSVRTLTDFTNELLEILPYPTSQNSCIVRFHTGVFEIQNLVEKMTYEVPGIEQICENTVFAVLASQGQKPNLELINSRTSTTLFSLIRDEIDKNAGGRILILSADEKCLFAFAAKTLESKKRGGFMKKQGKRKGKVC